VSCSGRTQWVPTPPNVGLLLFESRINGAGPAPDSVKVYLTKTDKRPEKSDMPIFEGQDVGRICYIWSNSRELHLRISGGYVDRVSQQWQDGGGRKVNGAFRGTKRLHWE